MKSAASADSSRRLRDSRLTVDIATVDLHGGDGLAVCLRRPGGVVHRRPRRALRQHDARLADGLPRLSGDVLRPADHDCRIDHLVRQLLQHQPPDLRRAGRPRRKRDAPHGRSRSAASAGSVEFQHVSFGYDKSRPVLEDVSFAIEPGEMVGVVGRSGSGKSTLVSLIGRLYECDAGQIRIDGIDVRQTNPPALRRQIGMVPQEPFLVPRLGGRKHHLWQSGKPRRNRSCWPPGMPIPTNSSCGCRSPIRNATGRRRLRAFRRRTAAAFDRPGLAVRSGDPDSRRSHGQRRRRVGKRHLQHDPPVDATANRDRHLPPPLHASRRRPAAGFRSRPLDRAGNPRGACRPRRNLLYAGERPGERGRNPPPAPTAPVGGGAISSIEPAIGEDGEDFLGSATQDSRGASTASENDDIHWLDPDAAAVENNQQGELRLISPAETVGGVYAVRAFLAEYERQYVSLRHRDESGRSHEVGMIDRLARWPRFGAGSDQPLAWPPLLAAPHSGNPPNPHQ